MNDKLQQAEAILTEHRQAMEASINAAIPRGAADQVEVQGAWPIFKVKCKPRPEPEDVVPGQPFQLQFTRGTASFSFTRGKVSAGGHLVVPTIGGVDVDNDPPPVMPYLGGGGQVFARYQWELDPLKVAPDWDDVFISCDLVQVPFGSSPPTDVMVETGVSAGVSTDRGTSYAFLMTYDASGRIVSYGQSGILDPDPDDLFPTAYVILAFPLVKYVA